MLMPRSPKGARLLITKPTNKLRVGVRADPEPAQVLHNIVRPAIPSVPITMPDK
jgi:hypothetical protein